MAVSIVCRVFGARTESNAKNILRANSSRQSRRAGLAAIVGASVLAILTAASAVCASPAQQRAHRPTKRSSAQSNPSADNIQQLVRTIIDNEVQSQLNDHTLWRFREVQQEDGATKVYDVVQTKTGNIHRLLAVNGRPLTGSEAAAEENRIQKLSYHPNQVQAAQKKRDADANEQRVLLKTFPDAFIFRDEGQQGSILKVGFVPNPNFRPTNHESEVFHHMEGTMLLDVKAKRLVEVDGHLTSKVKFLDGLLGHLDKGGTFHVVQRYIGAGHWDVTLLDVHMDGKALFFKTIAVRQKEIYSDYHEVPENISLQQAAQELKKDTTATAEMTGK